jgi:hypothetical protein
MRWQPAAVVPRHTKVNRQATSCRGVHCGGSVDEWAVSAAAGLVAIVLRTGVKCSIEQLGWWVAVGFGWPALPKIQWFTANPTVMSYQLRRGLHCLSAHDPVSLCGQCEAATATGGPVRPCCGLVWVHVCVLFRYTRGHRDGDHVSQGHLGGFGDSYRRHAAPSLRSPSAAAYRQLTSSSGTVHMPTDCTSVSEDSTPQNALRRLNRSPVSGRPRSDPWAPTPVSES